MILLAQQGLMAPTSAVFATWNSADKDPDAVLSGGDLTVSFSDTTNFGAVRATQGKSSGKHYWETSDAGNQSYAYGGIAQAAAAVANQWIGAQATSISGPLPIAASNGQCFQGGALLTTYAGMPSANGTPHTVRHKLDLDAGTYEVAVNAGAFITVKSGLTGTWYPAGSGRKSMADATYSCVANFGATPFAFSVPSGFRSGVFV